MAKIERTYNIPLRKEWLKVPRYKRTNKAVVALKAFLLRHMKSSEIKIGPYLNKRMWEHGIKNPPHHVKVNVVKDEKGIVTAELFGAPVVETKEAKKKAKKAEEVKAEAEKEIPAGTAPAEPKEEKPETAEAKKEPKKAKPAMPGNNLQKKSKNLKETGVANPKNKFKSA